MNYMQQLQKRYACKRMNNTSVDSEKLQRVVEGIHLSASSYGLQPYQVMIIQNAEIKKDIQALCNHQAQITECDALLIFTSFTNFPENYVANYIQQLSQQRKMPQEKLEPYKNLIITKTTQAMEAKTFEAWTAKQAYLALGTALMVCALEEIDACPIEGFDATQIDAYFKLPEKHLHASVMLAIGNRDPALDYNATMPKYRKPMSDLLIWKK